MATSTILDITSEFNSVGHKNIDMSGWDSVTIQLVTPTGTITFNGSNDDGSVTGAVQGNANSAINWTAIQATNLNTGAAATTGAASGLWRVSAFPRFLQLTGSSVTAGKILLYFSKIC